MELFRRWRLLIGLFLFLGSDHAAGQRSGLGTETEANEIRQIFIQWSDCLKQGQKDDVMAWR